MHIITRWLSRLHRMLRWLLRLHRHHHGHALEPADRDTLRVEAFSERLRGALAGAPPGAPAEDAVVWEDAGDEVLVHLDTLRVRTAPPALVAQVELETEETGRAPLIVRLVFGGPDDPAGLLAATDEVPHGHPALAAHWGRVLQDVVWAALLTAAREHAEASGGVPAGIEVRERGLYLPVQSAPDRSLADEARERVRRAAYAGAAP